LEGSAREPYVVHRDDLAVDDELQGFEHGGTGISLIFVDNSPGDGPALHRHRYDELFIVQEGQATFTADGREIVAGPGHVVVVPAGRPHGFVNSGDGALRLIAIHQSPRYETEWLA
jgi:mannose-6-phosphate isomerase-like protein (cupin superfamily)